MMVKLDQIIDNRPRRHIPISHSLYAIIDPADWPLVSKYHWRAIRSAHNLYALARKDRQPKSHYIRMHRLITNCPANKVVHHKNRNTLDNRRANLEVLTPEEHANR